MRQFIQKLSALALALSLTVSVAWGAEGIPEGCEPVGEPYNNYGQNDRVVKKNGQYGMVNGYGSEIVPLGTYSYLSGLSCGMAVAGTGAPRKTADGVTLPAEKFGLISSNGGAVVLPLEYDYVWPCDGVCIPVLKDGKVALLWPDGTAATPFRAVKLKVAEGAYRSPTPEDFGLKAMPMPDLSAYPELEVTWLPGYNLEDTTSCSSQGLLVARDVRTGRYGLLSADGTVAVPFDHALLSGYSKRDDRAPNRLYQPDRDYVWFFDAGGKLVETKYAHMSMEDNGLYAVIDAETGKTGYLNAQFQEVIPCVYERCDTFLAQNGGYTIAVLGDKAGLLDSKGNFTIPEGYDRVQAIAGGGRLVVAVKGERCTLLERETGKVVIPLGTYDGMNSIYQTTDLIQVSRYTDASGAESYRQGVIDLEGNVVIPLKYAGMTEWIADYVYTGLTFLVREPEGEWGLLDRQGKELLPCAYSIDMGGHMGPSGPGIYDVLHQLHPELPEYDYEAKEPPLSEGLARTTEISGEGAGKTGFVDESGALVIPKIFDTATDFSRGYSVVKLNGVYGLLKKPLSRDEASEGAAPAAQAHLTVEKAIDRVLGVWESSH